MIVYYYRHQILMIQMALLLQEVVLLHNSARLKMSLSMLIGKVLFTYVLGEITVFAQVDMQTSCRNNLLQIV